jgi:hypothetical protein
MGIPGWDWIALPASSMVVRFLQATIRRLGDANASTMGKPRERGSEFYGG